MKFENLTTLETTTNGQNVDQLNPFQKELLGRPETKGEPEPERPSEDPPTTAMEKQELDAFEKLWLLPSIILGGMDKNQLGVNTYEDVRDSFKGPIEEIDKVATERVLSTLSDSDRKSLERDRSDWQKAQHEYNLKFMRASSGTGMLGFPEEPSKPESIKRFEDEVDKMRAKMLEQVPLK